MSTQSSVGSGGITFPGALTLLFIALKLTGYIAWSWWWVLSPLWIAFALVMVGGTVYVCWQIYKEWRQEQQRTQKRNHLRKVS